MVSDRELHRRLAHSSAVRRVVRAERDRIKDAAETLFAPHDRPGGHKITTSNGIVDAYVSLEGPAAAALEFGHFTVPDKKGEVRFVEGLHVMGKAARS